MTQLTIFDYAEEIKPKDPPCYSCANAIRRGHFRLCRIGKSGYKKIGEWSSCSSWKDMEDEKNTVNRSWSRE